MYNLTLTLLAFAFYSPPEVEKLAPRPPLPQSTGKLSMLKIYYIDNTASSLKSGLGSSDSPGSLPT